MKKKLLSFALALAMLCTLCTGLGLTASAAGGVKPKVVSNFIHTLALNTEGRLFAWGENDKGQLGDGTTNNAAAPILIGGVFAGKTVVDIANGISFSMALTDDGKVYSWGSNALGALGDGTTTDNPTPKLISALAGKTVTKIFAAHYSSAAITSEGKLYVWGNIGANVPTEVGGALAGKTVTDAALGSKHAVAITNEHKAYSWGDNIFGQLGIGTTNSSNAPMLISSVSDVAGVAAGASHTVLLTSSGAVYTCGQNESGQLGNGETDAVSPGEPGGGLMPGEIPHPDMTEISFPGGVRIVSVSAGGGNNAVLGENGRAYAWGGSYGNEPALLTEFSNIVFLYCGWDLMAVARDGSVYAKDGSNAAARVPGVGSEGFLNLGATPVARGTYDVTGDYLAGAAAGEIYSVEISWGTLEFTYTDASEGTWDPDELKYENPVVAGWSCAAGADKITVTNRSNAAVVATLSFAKEAAVNVTAGFYDAATGGTAIPENKLSLASAAPVPPAETGEAKAACAYLRITSGSLTGGTDVKLGTVTVTVN